MHDLPALDRAGRAVEWLAMWEWLSAPDNLKIIGLVTALVSLAGAILGLVKHRQSKASRSQSVTADRGGIAAGRDAIVGAPPPKMGQGKQR